MGSAVVMAPNVFIRSSSGHSVAPTFLNCLFLENVVYVNFQQSHET